MSLIKKFLNLFTFNSSTTITGKKVVIKNCDENSSITINGKKYGNGTHYLENNKK